MSGGGVALAGQSACEPAGGLAAGSAGRVGGRPGARRRKAHVPEQIEFATKPEIALEQLRWACAAGLPRGVVLLDAGYGNNSELRADITALDLTYVAGILSTTTVWLPGTAPLLRSRWSGRERPTTRLRRDARHQPVSVKELALGLSKRAWRRIEWREGSAEPLASRFARLRIRVAHRDDQRADPRPQEWLLIEWPKGEAEPTKDWLSTLPNDIAFDRLVDLAKLRWRIERDYQELKQEVGTGAVRGAGLARLSSPRHPVHRSLRLPDLRAGDDSPLWTACRQVHPGGCAIRWLPTPRLRRCGPSVTSPTQSQPRAAA